MNDKIRAFETGATRSADVGRYDPEGFLSPIVIERFAQYMQKHRLQPDGSVRDSDNWQKGIPLASYVKGMWRHFLHFWTRHRGYKVQDTGAAANIEEDLCAIIFNAQGYLFELLKSRAKAASSDPADDVMTSDAMQKALDELDRRRGIRTQPLRFPQQDHSLLPRLVPHTPIDPDNQPLPEISLTPILPPGAFEAGIASDNYRAPLVDGQA